MEGSAAVLAPLALAVLVAIYFLPSIIASSRGHVSAAAIVALNLLAGWTALGWILALAWSLNSNTRENFHYLATGRDRRRPRAQRLDRTLAYRGEIRRQKEGHVVTQLVQSLLAFVVFPQGKGLLQEGGPPDVDFIIVSHCLSPSNAPA